MKIYFIAFITLFVGICPICQAQNSIIPEEVKDNVKSRVDNGEITGIVIGLITPQGTDYFSYGVKSLPTKEAVNKNTIFEIGSISKTFTGVLLADMVVKGELNLMDPLQNLLPEGVTAPTRNGETIKLFHLSNHTSSLPREAGNMTRPFTSNPYADYTKEKMYEALHNYELTHDIGTHFNYSNFATGLLGEVLASKRKMTYEELMVDIIAQPLGMDNTRVVFTPEMKTNLAMGHSHGEEVSNWDLPVLAGAGGIRSTAVDMVKYLSANMGIAKSSFYPAMQLSHQNTGIEYNDRIIGLGWQTGEHDGVEIIGHTGGTGGYRAYVGFIKGGDRGVVVLTNTAADIDDIGEYLLQLSTELHKPNIHNRLRSIFVNESIEKATKTYWELKETQADKYHFSEGELIMLGYEFYREDRMEKAIALFKLNIQAYPNFHGSYDSYGDALLKGGDKEGAIENYIKSVELHPGNIRVIDALKELGVETDKLIPEISVDNALLESYEGKYELAPGINITISAHDGQLKAQVTGNRELPIFPKSNNVFYYQVEQAQLTFNENKNGVVESMTLLQPAQERILKKLVGYPDKFDLTAHFDPTLPFKLIDQQHPSGVLIETEIQMNDSKHAQLLSWLKSNNHDWQKSTHNTHAGLIIVRQGDFHILFYRDNDMIVVGYNDDENVGHQYIKYIDSNVLRFLVED